MRKNLLLFENPKSLMEVWEWKEKVYEDSKSAPDKIKYFRKRTKDEGFAKKREVGKTKV